MLHADMEDKTYTFQIRVTSYNFTVNHQSFTVSRIINEIECVPAPDFDDNVCDGDDDDDKPESSKEKERLHPAMAFVRHQRILERSQFVMLIRRVRRASSESSIRRVI
ncbi:hypothetical protein Bca52824_060073 [Brassica carinata]|uniref:Uncharacterized protein n=1 Tax=Brassica carinata TaxID=52824 RepID=A0A8X7R0R2_BRACI|nr:hypothetical protein Bca52824_060073 [Brassica carinata]